MENTIRSINFGIEGSNGGEWLDPGMLLSWDLTCYYAYGNRSTRSGG
jgi:hypothetical protein